jgi:Zn-dependent protease
MWPSRRVPRLFSIGRVVGTAVYVHWSVVAISIVLVLSSVKDAASTLFLLAAYLGVLFLHEWGHLIVARRRGLAVWSIELYPIHGLTRYAAPVYRYDACIVAWGGVLAQFAVAIPLIAWTTIFGFTSIGPVNGLLAMFGYFSAVIAVVNLAPVARLDGAEAWRIVPLLWRRRRGLDRGVRTKRAAPTRKVAPRHKRPSAGGGWVH